MKLQIAGTSLMLMDLNVRRGPVDSVATATDNGAVAIFVALV